METSELQLSVVLVEPQHPGNVGATCRAMANFGVSDLRLVNPCPLDHPDAIAMAAGADQLLVEAKRFDNLRAALADTHYSFALTRRRGRLRGGRHRSSEIIEVVSRLPRDSRVALVFGREKSGLTSDEVAACSQGMSIPSETGSGSLNLAQAVVVMLYELRRGALDGTDATDHLPTHDELEPMLQQMDAVLERIGFVNQECPGASLHRLRQLIYRARPDTAELALLRSMWSQLERSVNAWPGRKRGEKRKD